MMMAWAQPGVYIGMPLWRGDQLSAVRQLPRWQLPDSTQLVTCPDTLLDWSPLLSPRLVPSEQISHIREAVAAISWGVKTQSNNWASYKVWNREQSCLLCMPAWRCENSGVMSLVGYHGGKTVKTVECVWAVVDDTCYKCKKIVLLGKFHQHGQFKLKIVTVNFVTWAYMYCGRHKIEICSIDWDDCNPIIQWSINILQHFRSFEVCNFTTYTNHKITISIYIYIYHRYKGHTHAYQDRHWYYVLSFFKTKMAHLLVIQIHTCQRQELVCPV